MRKPRHIPGGSRGGNSEGGLQASISGKAVQPWMYRERIGLARVCRGGINDHTLLQCLDCNGEAAVAGLPGSEAADG